MTSVRKDTAATVAMTLAVLAYLTTHEGWDVWLIGDNHRRATAAIVLLGLVTFAVSWLDESLKPMTVAKFALVAALFAGLAFGTGSLTPLSLLLVCIVVLWGVSLFEDVWHSIHRPVAS